MRRGRFIKRPFVGAATGPDKRRITKKRFRSLGWGDSLDEYQELSSIGFNL